MRRGHLDPRIRSLIVIVKWFVWPNYIRKTCHHAQPTCKVATMAAIEKLPTRQRRITRPLRPSSNSGSTISPSPILSSLSSENPKGVKSITRKVIKRLEGLGHLETMDTDFSVPEEDEFDSRCEEHEVEKVFTASSGMGQMDGNGVGKTNASKTDFEIPRKMLHSSIGTFFRFFLCNMLKLGA